MKKRYFLATTASLLGSLASLPLRATPKSVPAADPAILTVTGAIKRSNRGPIDPVIDQMMYKQSIKFDRAFTFALSALKKLPAITISPTMEYDGKPHRLRGPLLADLLDTLGANNSPDTQIVFHAVDGYMPRLSFKQLRQYRYILATQIDDKPLSIGGFGPLFAIYDTDSFPEQASKPLNTRFTLCPWGVYCIEVLEKG